VADVHAAREGRLDVHDEDLAVIAKRLEQELWKERVEEAHLDAELAHPVPETAAGRQRSERGPPNPHLDAAPHGARERVAEGAAGLVVLEDVGLDQHFLPRGIDRRLHGLEGLRPAEEDLDAVALQDRRLVDALKQYRESRVAKALRQLGGEL